jgi:hypothetical protein
MAKVNVGLRKMIEEGRIPSDRYTFEIKKIDVRKGWEIARCVVVEAKDDEILGRSAGLFLLNSDQGNSIGLQQLMTAMHWEEIPEDEDGERDTKTSLIGVKFEGDISYDNGQMRLRPVIDEEDWEWQRDLLGESETTSNDEEEEETEEEEEEEEEEEKPRSKTKGSSSKKTAPPPPPPKKKKSKR